MAGRKQVYKITYPNGKIYVGVDVTGTLTYFGSPSARERIFADVDEHRHDLTVRKEILWESETATKSEALAMEIKLIRETGANNPEIGYNLRPRWL
jgi:hypothetical protein